MAQVLAPYIEKSAGICGGHAHIAGHRIRVMDVVIWHERCGWTADDIVAQFPQLSLAQVYAALAYYWDHLEEIRQAIAEEDARVERLRQQIASKAAERVRRAREDSLPPG